MLRLILLFSFLTFNVFADELENGDRARFNYEGTTVYKILSVTPVLQSEGGDIFSGHLKITALVEGNICQNFPKSLGTFVVKDQNRSFVYLLVRHHKTSDQDQCAQYSKEVKIHANIKTHLAHGEKRIFDLGGNTIALEEVNGKWTATITNPQKK